VGDAPDPAQVLLGQRLVEAEIVDVFGLDVAPDASTADELYDAIFVRPAKWLGRLLWKGGDGWLIDGFGPDGVSARVLDVTRNVMRLQTGYLYHYAFAMLIGAAAFITWFMFAVH